jgi:hypothetical protein
VKEIQQEPNLPAPTDCFGNEKPIATWYECPNCGKASPLTRQWVGLTDDEFQACFEHADGTLGSLMYAIEAKLKEKNT